MKKSIKSKFSVYKLIICTILILYALTMFFVIYWCAVTSLKTKEDFGKYFNNNRLSIPSGAPWKWAWTNFGYVFQNLTVTSQSTGEPIGIFRILLNTVVYSVGGAFLATLIPCVVAYVTAKFPSKFSTFIVSLVIVLMALPIVGNLPSMLAMMQTLGIYNTLVGTLLQKCHFLNVYFMVFYATFKGLAKDYAEAAYMDGASEIRIFIQIMMPLVRTGFMTIMLIFFIELWNDYQTPLLYMPACPTLSLAVLDVTNGIISGKSTFGSETPYKMAACIIMVIPCTVLFLIFKNRMIGNLSMGGIKG